MADNYLEYARDDYERRKAEWLKKKKHHIQTKVKRTIEKPEDWSL